MKLTIKPASDGSRVGGWGLEDSLPHTLEMLIRFDHLLRGYRGGGTTSRKNPFFISARVLLICVGSIFVEVQRARSSEILAASTRMTVSTSLNRFAFVSPSLRRPVFGRLVRTGGTLLCGLGSSQLGRNELRHDPLERHQNII